VRWSFTLLGQPPSWNQSYHITKQQGYRKDGRPYEFSSLSKRQKVIDYQAGAVLVIRSAKPSRWAPTGDVRILWRIYLTRDIDCDNLMKAVHDAIERATDVNDRRFLPCVQSKVWGVHPTEARIEITVEDVDQSS
jgi:Holliday junction resolvase RusA-like endonuclease